MDERLQTILDVREIVDRLGEIGASRMGDFTFSQAAFYHAATEMLLRWADHIDEFDAEHKA